MSSESREAAAAARHRSARLRMPSFDSLDREKR